VFEKFENTLGLMQFIGVFCEIQKAQKLAGLRIPSGRVAMS